MLRTRLLTAAAAVALLGAPAAFAQDMPAQEPVTPMPTQPAPTTPATTDTSAEPAAQAQAETPAAANTIVDTLKAQGQFSTLLSALDQAQLTETLKAQPAVSIFAPTDAAFAALPEADRTRLMDPANANELRQLLLYHVVVADVNSSQIKGTKGGVETAARTQVQLDGTGDAIKVDDATVTMADIDAGNGAVFAIDKVLNPAASNVASGDAEEAAPAPAAPPAPTPAPTASPDPVTTPDPNAAAEPTPTPTPPVTQPDPASEPTPEPVDPATPPTEPQA
ncbi:fasciclin domain-containing protein [Brevundimonas sp. VNH65]|uniref:fasciclin domain-containing protein n=1 Tax=Brevundimonas sp. VNH65 TaxID=3400917 RepID=UPI003C0A49BE